MYTFGETLLQTKNVSLVFDDEKDKNGKKKKSTILHDINLEIKDILVPGRKTGQIIGLVAPSGRGKTQLFKMLAGLSKPTTGEILINGKPVKAGNVGVVAQSYPLLEHRTIRGNLDRAFHKGETKQEKTEKINEYLERFKLIEHIDKWPAQLSGGQRQRIAVIQQLLCSDHYILLDEPFSGLDPVMTKAVCSLIKEIADMDELNTFIVISHDIRSTCSISNILWMLGYEYDGTGNPIRENGSTIKYIENLMDKGFCWRNDDVTRLPEFKEFVDKVETVFREL